MNDITQNFATFAKTIEQMKRQILFFFLALVVCMSTEAKVQLPRLFQSGMVLQRNKPIPVWGKADPQEKVFIRWNKREYATVADGDGRWRIDLPKMKAGGPYTMMVGDIVLTDVLVGDVWLCSGQSNIDVTIERVYPQYVDEIGFVCSVYRTRRTPMACRTISVRRPSTGSR